MIIRTIVLLLALSISLWGKSRPFMLHDISRYLKEENPFYYRAIGEQFIQKASLDAAYGVTDLQLNATHDDKRYAITKGEYQSASLTKNLLNGTSLSVGYRRAQGLQEYNNIITGPDGEIIAGVSLSLFSLINNMSKNKADIENAKLRYLSSQSQTQLNLLDLKFNLGKLYYQTRLAYTLYSLEKALLQKARRSQRFIAKKIQNGILPKSASIEIEQLILQRQIRVTEAHNRFIQIENLLIQYLGLTPDRFHQYYRITPLHATIPTPPSKKSLYEDALRSRPELTLNRYEASRIELQQRYNELSAYGDLTVGLRGNYDMRYKEGYKTSLNYAIPIERSYYKGTKEALKLKKILNENKRIARISELKTTINNLYVAHTQLKKGLDYLQKELQRAIRLEKIETRKLLEGVGSLIFVNQREINTLLIRQKIAQYRFDLQVNRLEMNYYGGELSF